MFIFSILCAECRELIAWYWMLRPDFRASSVYVERGLCRNVGLSKCGIWLSSSRHDHIELQPIGLDSEIDALSQLCMSKRIMWKCSSWDCSPKCRFSFSSSLISGCVWPKQSNRSLNWNFARILRSIVDQVKVVFCDSLGVGIMGSGGNKGGVAASLQVHLSFNLLRAWFFPSVSRASIHTHAHTHSYAHANRVVCRGDVDSGTLHAMVGRIL